MVESEPATRFSLLDRLKLADNESAWTEFCAIYEPLIYQFARQRQLQHADAEDVVRQVIQGFLKRSDSFQYDGSRGHFRGYLFAATRNCVNRLLKGKQQHAIGLGGEEKLVELVADSGSESDEFDRLYSAHLFSEAIQRARAQVREETYTAWDRTAVHQQTAQQVADLLQIRVSAVYNHRSRMNRRIRDQLLLLDPDFELR